MFMTKICLLGVFVTSSLTRPRRHPTWQSDVAQESARSNSVFIWAEPINSAHLYFFAANFGELHGPSPTIRPFYFLGHGLFVPVVLVFFFYKMGPLVKLVALVRF